MRIKRVISAALACAAAVSLLTVSAYAHGGCHGGRVRARQTVIPVCTVDGCSTAGRHVHDGVVYCGYGHENGYCSGACLGLCPVEGCTTAGRHIHNGVAYCGNDHSCGYCDGTCALSPRCGCHH